MPNTLDDWTRRIQALLAKAESTEFAAERESLLAKAQTLMTRHAIDEAMIAAAGGKRDDLITRIVVVPQPYVSAKSALLGAVARANRCRLVLQGGVRSGQCVLLGHRTDVDSSVVLFTALSLHATREMLSAGIPEGDSPKRFRHAFLLAFAVRIGARLREAALLAEREAGVATGTSTAVVLAGVDAAVEAFVADEFPHLASSRTRTASSSAGLRSGHAAASRAALNTAVSGAPLGLGS